MTLRTAVYVCAAMIQITELCSTIEQVQYKIWKYIVVTNKNLEV